MYELEAEALAADWGKKKKQHTNQNPLSIMAQYGWQNTVACVGKWLQSNVWNHLSSGRVWKMTVLCILQKSLLIDFIYLGGGGTVTDGRDNWGEKKKWILYIILTSCSGQGCWDPQGDRTMLGSPACPATAFATTHRQRFAFFSSGSQRAKNCGFCLHWCWAHFWNYDLQKSEEEWTEVDPGLCSLLVAWLVVKGGERICEKSGGKVCFQCAGLAQMAHPGFANEVCVLEYTFLLLFVTKIAAISSASLFVRNKEFVKHGRDNRDMLYISVFPLPCCYICVCFACLSVKVFPFKSFHLTSQHGSRLLYTRHIYSRLLSCCREKVPTFSYDGTRVGVYVS